MSKEPASNVLVENNDLTEQRRGLASGMP